MPNDCPEMGQILDKATNLMNNSKFSDAIEALEKAVSIDPKNRLVWDRVIICNLELKRPKKALEAMNSILSIDPTEYRVWADKAYLHFLLQEDGEGVEALRNSLKLNPRNYRDWYLLGTIYMTNEKWDESRDAFHNALQLNPSDSAIWYSLAAVNYMLGDFGAALGAAEQATAIDPTMDLSEDEWLEDLKETFDPFSEDDEDDFFMNLAAGS